jgi:hypothetical protein
MPTIADGNMHGPRFMDRAALHNLGRKWPQAPHHPERSYKVA